MCHLCQFEIEVVELKHWKIRQYFQLYINGFEEEQFLAWLARSLRVREFEFGISSSPDGPVKGELKFIEHETGKFEELFAEVLERWGEFKGTGNSDVLFTPLSALPPNFLVDHPGPDVIELSRSGSDGYAEVSAGDCFWIVERLGCLTTVRPR